MGLSKYLKVRDDYNLMNNNNISKNMIVPQFEGKWQIRLNNDKSPHRDSKGFGKSNTMKDNPNTSTFIMNKVRGINYNHNVGLLTGKINGITCIDLDFYDNDKSFDKENNKFIKTFGMPSNDNKYIFNTFTNITPKGGYHLVFEYDEDIRQTQTKDIPFFGEDDVYAVQYDVLGNPKVSNTARFDVRPGEALWNLITPFDIKRGEEPEEWQKTLYRIGMPLSFKRDQLNGIRLSEKQKSDWVRIAKNEVYEKIGNQPPLKFKAALRYLVSTIAFKKYDLTKQQNLVRSLEDKFYKKAVQTLLRLEGNEQLRAVYDDREYYKNDLKQRIIINP